MTNQYSELHSVHMDVLREIGNIGTGHAASSLSYMIGHTIDMSVPKVQIVPFEQVMDSEGLDNTVVASHFLVEGELDGHFFVMFPLDQVGMILKEPLVRAGLTIEPIHPTSSSGSAYCELSNIMAGAYLSALSDFTSVKALLSPPELCIDLGYLLLGEGILDLSTNNNEAIVVDTVMSDRKTNQTVAGKLAFLPSPESLTRLFYQLGVDYGHSSD